MRADTGALAGFPVVGISAVGLAAQQDVRLDRIEALHPRLIGDTHTGVVPGGRDLGAWGGPELECGIEYEQGRDEEEGGDETYAGHELAPFCLLLFFFCRHP